MDGELVRTYTAYIERDPESGLFVGSVPGLPGAHTQGSTLDELGENLREVIALVLEERRSRGESIEADSFVGVQRITVRL